MKKVFDIALICVIIIVAFYACSEDYFAPHKENLELNAHDPRLELIAEIDSTKLQLSRVETLSNGESINSGGKSINIAQYRSYNGYTLTLSSTLHIEFYIDEQNRRQITYAAATLPMLIGVLPQGSRFTAVSEIPRCQVLESSVGDDIVELSVAVTLDYGNFFEYNDDKREDKIYTKIINPFE